MQPEEVWQQEATQKRQRRAVLNADPRNRTIQYASDTFAALVKEGPIYVCTCCHRLMYHRSVLRFQEKNYVKLSLTSTKVFDTQYIQRSVNQEVWICQTCHRTLKRGKMPAQAKANNLYLAVIPPELPDLNELETRLICLRIPFMKMVSLAVGKQKKISGPAVNVPTDLKPVCRILPRLPSQTQLVTMKLKRKLCYKTHHYQGYVLPDKVMTALQWLKTNNPLYAAIDINDSWLEDAPTDDAELWTALTAADTESENATANDEPQPCTSPDIDINEDDTWLEDALRDDPELWTAVCATDTESANTSTDHQPQLSTCTTPDVTTDKSPSASTSACKFYVHVFMIWCASNSVYMYITCCAIQPYSNVCLVSCALINVVRIHIAGQQKTPISVTKHEFLEYIEEQKSSNAGLLDVTIPCTCTVYREIFVVKIFSWLSQTTKI